MRRIMTEDICILIENLESEPESRVELHGSGYVEVTNWLFIECFGMVRRLSQVAPPIPPVALQMG